MAKISLTGNIGKPMLTLHGTLDTLLPISRDSDVYTSMINAAGKGAIHRYYTIDKGNHVDSLYDVPTFTDKLRPILPCYRAAFDAMTGWVEKGTAPPPSGFVPADGPDVANVCGLPKVLPAASSGSSTSSSTSSSRADAATPAAPVQTKATFTG